MNVPIVVMKEIKSAMGILLHTPVIPQKRGNINKNGIKNNNCRERDKNMETRPISDGFRKNNVNYWAFREIRSIIPHL